MLIAVFRSRTETLNFASILKSYRIVCSIINTPKRINVSCGISVKFYEKDLDYVKAILSRRRFETFAGIFHN